ncbi:MAG: sigma-70 family RNA polymerase sigma factor [candidate division Zixibacteria bacterium]|nr:sigma-70 family RNA polymerase sigma factor [candidate division Zixibacteria bacterium]
MAFDNLKDEKLAKERLSNSSEKKEEELLEIIKKAQGGDQEAFQEIVQRYKVQVAGIAYRMVGDYEDAKDISQMVFVKIYQNLHRFDTTKKLSTWLYRITINASIDFIRKFRKHKLEVLDNIIGELKEKKNDVEGVYQRGLIRLAVDEALESLNPKQRSVFVLRDLEGLDIKEVSQVTGMPQATVRWYLHRARAKLRDELVKHHPSILEKAGIKYEVQKR